MSDLFFTVTLRGTVLPGFDANAAIAGLAKLIKRDEQFARQLLCGEPVKIKSGVDSVLGERYVTTLMSIGAAAFLQAETIEIDADLAERAAVLQTFRGPIIDAEAASAMNKRIALWNPNTSATLSFFLTPVFGSYLHMCNWRALGEEQKASRAQTWFIGSIVIWIGFVFAPYLFILNKATSSTESISNLEYGVALIYLLSWYFIEARAQVAHLKRIDFSTLQWKSWWSPLAIAVIAKSAYIFVSLVAVGTLRPELSKLPDASSARHSVAPQPVQTSNTTAGVPRGLTPYSGPVDPPYIDPSTVIWDAPSAPASTLAARLTGTWMCQSLDENSKGEATTITYNANGTILRAGHWFFKDDQNLYEENPFSDRLDGNLRVQVDWDSSNLRHFYRQVLANGPRLECFKSSQ